MEEKELTRAWKSSSKKQNIMIDKEKLLHCFKTAMEHREGIVRRRDRKEIFYAGIGVIAYTFFATQFGYSMATLGLVIVALSFCYYIYKLRSNRKSLHTKELFLPLREQLLHQKAFMERQARLLDTVLYWAAIPIFTGFLIFTWSPENTDLSSIALAIYPEKFSTKVITTLFLGSGFAYMVWTNKKAARVNWKPLIDQIDAILEQLKKE